MAIHRAVERSIVTMASGSFLASLQKKRAAPASLNKTKCWDALGEIHDQKYDKNNRKEPVEDRVDQCGNQFDVAICALQPTGDWVAPLIL